MTPGPADPGHPAGPADPGHPGHPADPAYPDPGDLDPGLARERTSLAWTRTALSFAAVGGVVLKKDVIAGLIIMSATPAIWQLGRLAHHRPGRLKLVTATIVAVSLVALAVAVTH
jgi:uncharacterized membrane protein YidH (DUF202 family)